MITAMQRQKGNLRGTWDPFQLLSLVQASNRFGILADKSGYFTNSFASTQHTTNTLIDAKYLYRKHMLGMGVAWCGLIGPWSEWEKKNMQFSKSQPQKSLEKNKALSSALGEYFFFHPPVVCCSRERWEQPQSSSVGACHIVLLQFYISIKAM